MHPILDDLFETEDLLPAFEANHEFATLMPEVEALKGRIQPPQHHPEGDAYVHTFLVVKRAWEIDAATIDLWGAFVHDLGKAVTDDNNLPHHFAHEALGVPLVRTLGERLGVPEDMIVFGQLCAKEHLNIHKFLDLRPVKKVDLLERVNAVGVEHFGYGNAQRDFPLICNLALVAQADAQGRGPTFVDRPYPQRQAAIEAWYLIRDIHYNDPQKQRMARANAIAGKFGK